MMISEVMRRVQSEHEVLFLLSAYVETLQFHGAARRLPPGAVHLPVRDMDDVEARFSDMLGAGMKCGDAPDSHGAVLNEATEVFGTAVRRLHTLRHPAPATTQFAEEI